MDDVLAEIVREAEANPDVAAVVLGGSRSQGHERPDSDYDIYYVTLSGTGPSAPDHVEAPTISLDELRVVEPYWWTDGSARVSTPPTPSGTWSKRSPRWTASGHGSTTG